LRRLAGCIDRGLTAVADERKVISGHVKEVARVQAPLARESGGVPGDGSVLSRCKETWRVAGTACGSRWRWGG